jgi:small subunit ribosomal protein S4e
MAHQKRLSAPQHYPVQRKGNAYVIKGGGPHSEDEGVPVGVLLRDVLGYADNVDEAQEILNSRNVHINGAVESDVHRTVGFMDVIEIDKIDTTYRVLVNETGLVFQEVSDSDNRLHRIEDKTTLKGGHAQLNLDSGENLVTDEAYSTRGSLLLDLSSGAVQKELPLEEGKLAYITGGQHVGELATVQEVNTVRGPQSNKVVLENDENEFETVVDFVYIVGDDDLEVELG